MKIHPYSTVLNPYKTPLEMILGASYEDIIEKYFMLQYERDKMLEVKQQMLSDFLKGIISYKCLLDNVEWIDTEIKNLERKILYTHTDIDLFKLFR